MEHVFVADTNLFFECLRLDMLPWSDLAVDPIVIALIKPVLAEIDKHKKGGGRTRKRAIEISGRIREMLATISPEVVVQEAGPRVLLRLMPIVQPAPELATSLDYGINDDRIVGTVATLSKDVTFASVSILTDDSVAASTAQGLGLSFFLIPERWRRQPEETTESKRIKELERDLSAYRAQEPVISITDASGGATLVNVVRRLALALEPSEIDQLICKLKKRHPPKEDFSTPKAKIQADGIEISYEMPDAEAITKYTSEAYPKWIDACRSIFESLHKGRIEYEAKVVLVFGVANGGTRPASKMRVSFEAIGDIELIRDEHGSDDDEDRNKNDTKASPLPLPKLPAPPVAPMVRLIKRLPPSVPTGTDGAKLNLALTAPKRSILDQALLGAKGELSSQMAAMRNAEKLSENVRDIGLFSDRMRGIHSTPDIMRVIDKATRIQDSLNKATGIVMPNFNNVIDNRILSTPKKHDPESFYYVEWSKRVPTKHGALTCDLFRHHRGEEFFEIDVLFPEDGDVTGAVRCTVEAENLTKPEKILIPVSRKIETYSLMVYAENMIEDCG